MLADFDIPRLWNDMKIAVQKNHLVGQILYRSLNPSKKRRFFLNHMAHARRLNFFRKLFLYKG